MKGKLVYVQAVEQILRTIGVTPDRRLGDLQSVREVRFVSFWIRLILKKDPPEFSYPVYPAEFP